jgi:RNA-directed DNA polymerase
MSERNTDSTQRLAAVYTKLRQISEKAKTEPQLQFTSLAHLLTEELLRASFEQLRKDAAPGADGVTWADYACDLEPNLRELHQQLNEGRYRAQPVRRVHIEKEDGKLRPLGIPSTVDKIVQRATVTILEAIYEQDFYTFSHGFRPGRKAWDALDKLREHLNVGRVNYVIDADIKGYFDNVVQSHLMEFVRRRIKDRNILRLVSKWLRAGVIDGGRLLVSKLGTPQGSVISPLLANIYLHYVLDEWWQQEVLPRMRGTAYLVRYADDFVMGFQYPEDAERVFKVLGQRFARYGLELHSDKTRLIPFGPYAEKSESFHGRVGGSETFDFLGFTHLCARNIDGRLTVQVRTMAKRLRRSLRAVTEWCRANRHRPIAEQHQMLSAKLRGHYNYYGRRTNSYGIGTFYHHVRRIWFKWLERRAQRRTLNWVAFAKLLEQYPLPLPHITQGPGWAPSVSR